MKKTILILISFLGLPAVLWAQTPTFTVPNDTVDYTFTTTSGTPSDNITNITGSNLNLQWQVISSDFPANWLTANAFGICDNQLCRQNSDDTLWNNVSNYGHNFTSTYGSNASHDSMGGFNLSLNYDSASFGCHYVTIRIEDLTSTYTKNITFNICLPALGVPTVSSTAENVNIYPNPATTDLNVVYDAGSNIKNIAIYNIIGKIMKIYKVSGNSANLNLDNIPSGFYFVRLLNSNGDPVVTKKFTKQ